jgi:hypothetical protein
MSSTHGRHVGVVPGHLDLSCERCLEMRVGDLDSAHLVNVCGLTRPELQDLFGNSPFWDAIVGENALRMRSRYHEVLRRAGRGTR